MGQEEFLTQLKRQVTLRGIGTDSVLKAFAQVDRGYFVPQEDEDRAYKDTQISWEYGHTAAQPAMMIEMLSELNIQPGDKVLEVGAGSGYPLAILYHLGAQPYGIEIVEELALRINDNLKKAGVPPLPVKTGDGTEGWIEEHPFDKIVISDAAQTIPVQLIDQLKIGGAMVASMGNASLQRLTVIRKKRDAISVEEKTLCFFLPKLMNTVI